MDATIAAIIAVLGTLLGSALTYVFQTRSADRAEGFTRSRELRTQRLAVYSQFASALTEYRRGQYDWWNRQNEDPAGTDAFEARKESYRLRGVAQSALFQVRLITTDPELTGLAQCAYDMTADVRKGPTSADLKNLGDAASTALGEFIRHAASKEQPDLPGSRPASHGRPPE